MSSVLKLLVQLRQSFLLKGKATFWFGGVISAVLNQLDENLQSEIMNEELEADSYCQFVKILNQTVVSGMLFYEQNIPDNFFRFITFCQSIVTARNNKNIERSYNVVLSRLSLRNNLIIQALIRKQYNKIFWECQQIMKEFNESRIDCFHLCYVTFFSNFLSVVSKLEVKRSKNLEVRYLSEQIETNLILVLSKLIDKYQQIINGEGSIDLTELQIVIAVFIKHKSILELKLQPQLQSLISTIIAHTKYRTLTSSIYINKIYKEKIKKQIILNFQLPFYEFNCFSININTSLKTKNKLKKHLSTKQETQKQDTDQNHRLIKIQKMLEQHLFTINQIKNNTQTITYQNHSTISPDLKTGKITGRFRRLSNLNSTFQNYSQSIDINKTIQVKEFDLNENGFNKPTNQTINNVFQSMTERKAPRCGYNYGVMQHMISPTKLKNMVGRTETKRYHHNFNISSINNNHSQLYSHISLHPLLKTHNVLHFKMGSIFIEVNDDGMLFSDYTKENKRYVEWNTISQILLRVQYKFIYKSYLSQGIFNYYDVIRILKLYLSKSQINTITVNQYPNMILQLNEFIRFYQQDGHFTKLAHMNIYDNSKLQSEIDCYLQEFNHFFKTVSSDGYLEYLEQKAFKINEKQKNIREEVFYLQVLRKHNDSIRLELQNQLTVDIVESVTNDREFLYRALFILKNNIRLYAKIQFSDNNQKGVNSNKSQSQFQRVTITIKNLSQNNLPFIRHTLPLSIFYHYIPLGQFSPTAYIQNYGRLIFQSFNNFENIFDDSMVSMLNFQIITHCCLTEMIEIGKYWTVCSAEIIGSKKTVYGIVIRYAFLPMNKDYVTFLRNPYCGFLSGLISMSKQQKKKSLRNLLVDESVKQTYLYLQRSKKINQVSSLIQYLSEGLGMM